jgi:RNA polymerase sigma factor for flagellar operon FliA
MKKQKIEHLDLWEQLQNVKTQHQKDKIKRQLAEIYFPLVKKISYAMAKHLEWKVSAEELASFGVDGLYVAIDRFSLSRGTNFPAYASIRIRGSMIDGIRKEDLIPRSVRSNYNRLEKAKAKLEAERGASITEDEIAEEAGVDPDDVLRNSKKYTPVTFVSIDGSDICDRSRQEDFKPDSIDVLHDPKSGIPDGKMLRREFLFKLISKGFSKIEQRIIYMYYYQGLTMDAIASKVDMSESRISQIHKDIIPRLKDKITRNPKYFGADVEKFVAENDDKEPLFAL